MDFHAAMETFAEAWVAANSNSQGQSQGHHDTQVTNMMYNSLYSHILSI